MPLPLRASRDLTASLLIAAPSIAAQPLPVRTSWLFLLEVGLAIDASAPTQVHTPFIADGRGAFLISNNERAHGVVANWEGGVGR